MVIKVKFFELPGFEADDETKRIRVKFTKKRGNIGDWYEMFKEMKEATLNAEEGVEALLVTQAQ